MSAVKHFIEESVKKAEIDEFFWREFEMAGFGGVDITRTPLGTNIVVYVMRPGIIIGRGGRTIKNLAVILEEDFNLPNPQISVAEIEIPELDAHVMASRVASALRRGVHFRRAGYWALNQIMDAGALGVEITISGRLRTMRARREKFRGGYMPKSGEPVIKYVRKAVVHVQLKPGVLGVKMQILPPGIELPDQVEMLKAKEAPEEMNQPASEEEAATAETTVEAEE
jgi:small subunit ribosomal protein S3